MSNRKRRVRVPRYALERTCVITGKRQYDNPDEARSELKAIRKKRYATGRTKNVEKRPYLCPSCLKYHLTSEMERR